MLYQTTLTFFLALTAAAVPFEKREDAVGTAVAAVTSVAGTLVSDVLGSVATDVADNVNGLVYDVAQIVPIIGPADEDLIGIVVDGVTKVVSVAVDLLDDIIGLNAHLPTETAHA